MTNNETGRGLTALGAIALLAVGVASGVAYAHHSGKPVDLDAGYVEKRTRAITYHAARAPASEPLLIGDSIVELSSLDTICGRPVLNAGVSGATLADVARLARELHRTPGLVIVSVGVNDTVRKRAAELSTWAREYDALLASYPNARKVVIGISGVEDGKRAGSNYFDPKRIDQLNAQLPAIAARHHAIFVPGIAHTNGLTNDGVHFAPQGFERWESDIRTAVSRSGACDQGGT